MKHISILIPEGHSSLVNIEGTHQILTDVNTMLLEKGREPIFDVHLVGISAKATQRKGLFTITPDALIDDVQKTDLIIIPSLHGDQHQAIELNKKFLPWITQQYHRGAEVASLCLGAFFLAATGLLNGKPCATHWKLAHEFRSMFPEVKLSDDKIITEDNRLYTSGGAYSSLNLITYLIEKYAGHDMAIMAAKSYAIDMDRTTQSQFIIFQGQKSHNDDLIRKIQEFIEGNYQEKLTVDLLSDKVNIGRRSFERRFKKATGNSVIEYVQRIKIEAAKHDLETSRKNINEVVYDIGYTDSKSFRSVFKKVTGLTPIEYRNKYNKQILTVA
jgi:transcriptional regulator GlxA family with amidase domain